MTRWHFIGVGGSGMAPVAHLTAARGIELSGSARAASKYFLALQESGANVVVGHEPALVEIETVAGRFVRLIIGGGFPETSLVRLRNQIRAGGDYAMIMPVPLGNAPRAGGSGKKPAPGS